jgi:hypothetical protein
MSERVFRHADPAKTPADGNAAHAGPQKEHFAYETNAYAGNVFYDIAQMGVFEASGRWLQRWTISAPRCRTAAAWFPIWESWTKSRRCAIRPAAISASTGSRRRWTRERWPSCPGRCTGWSPSGISTRRQRPHADHRRALVRQGLPDRPHRVPRPADLSADRPSTSTGDYIDGPLENFTPAPSGSTPAKKTYATVRTPTSIPTLHRQAGHAGQSRPGSAAAGIHLRGRRPQEPRDPRRQLPDRSLFPADGDGLIIGKQQGRVTRSKLRTAGPRSASRARAASAPN